MRGGCCRPLSRDLACPSFSASGGPASSSCSGKEPRRAVGGFARWDSNGNFGSTGPGQCHGTPTTKVARDPEPVNTPSRRVLLLNAPPASKRRLGRTLPTCRRRPLPPPWGSPSFWLAAYGGATRASFSSSGRARPRGGAGSARSGCIGRCGSIGHDRCRGTTTATETTPELDQGLLRATLLLARSR